MTQNPTACSGVFELYYDEEAGASSKTKNNSGATHHNQSFITNTSSKSRLSLQWGFELYYGEETGASSKTKDSIRIKGFEMTSLYFQ